MVRIGQNPACDISAATCVDETTDGGGWYVAERNWQYRTLLHPAGWVRCKLPNLVGPNAVRNIEATQNDERVVEHSEATGQNAGCAGRPVTTGNGDDTIGDGVVAEDATGAGLADEIGAGCAVNVRRPRVSQYAARHIVGKGVGVSG